MRLRPYLAAILSMLTSSPCLAREAFIAQLSATPIASREISGNGAAEGVLRASRIASPLPLGAAKPVESSPHNPMNVSSITQQGTNNFAAVSQTGGRNLSAIVQTGAGNQAVVTQHR